VWPDSAVEKLVTEKFIPVRVHARDQADEFRRLGQEYGAEWTPTILMLDPSGEERHRMEGFLPVPEFLPQLEMGLGRIAFSRGDFDAADRRFRSIVAEHPDADVAPDALYWAGVSRYKATDDAAALKETAAALKERYPDSPAAKKGSVWARG
jgi:Tetratricopeptide repeat